MGPVKDQWSGGEVDSSIEAVDYGPLAGLPGRWVGDDGLDLAPDPEGVERNRYRESLTFEPAGHVSNAERQTLAAIRYHQVVRRASTGEVFHDQVGYWLWQPGSDQVVQTLTIGRGVAVVAEGSADVDARVVRLSVSANPERGIAQSRFMFGDARTVAFEHVIELAGDELRYRETTRVDIYGKRGFEHVDSNVLRRQRSD